MMKKHILNKIAYIKINLKNISRLLILALNIYIQFISISLAQSVGSDNFNFVGKVYVSDGDTIKSKNNEIKIRLHGIDAPEAKQTCKNHNDVKYSCGYRSTKFLKSLINKKRIKCTTKDKDRYGRLIAVCFSGKININATMVREGWAIAYRYYSKDYVNEEEIAKAKKKGIWQGSFIEPYIWRKNN